MDDLQFEDYIPCDLEGNINKAVRNYRKAYWSNEMHIEAIDATEIILSAIVHWGYTLTKENEHEHID